MKTLAIADLHDWNKDEIELIRDLKYGCCCLLGNILDKALEIIKQLVHKPLLCVLGNLCVYRYAIISFPERITEWIF